MKKIILTIIAMLAIGTASAQVKVFAKQTKNKTYYRVQLPHGKTTYAVLSAKDKPSVDELQDFENQISENKYMKVLQEEHEVDMPTQGFKKEKFSQGHHNTSWVTDIERQEPLGEKDIRVQPAPQVALNSSTPFVEGDQYPLFKVVEAKDPDLVGLPVITQVLYRRKSNISGSEGKLFLNPLYIKKNDGTRIYLRSTPVFRRGLNRTNAKAFTSPLILPLFFPGTGAKIHPEETFTLTIE